MNFFRKYQKPILFTAVLFALVTFSITGDMLSFFGGVFQKPIPRSSITVDGRRVELTDEDYVIARDIVRRLQWDIVPVLPDISSVDPNDRMIDAVAALRRRAILAGIEASWDEVDRAIDATSANHDNVDPRSLGAIFSSYEHYRRTVFESMRVATMVRLESLGARLFDYDVVERALADKHRIGVRVASLDREELESEIEARLDGEADADKVLSAWLKGLEDTDRRRLGFNAEDRVKLEFVQVALESFNPEEFTEELKDFEVSDAEVERLYNVNKLQLFKVEKAEVEGPPEPKDNEDKDKDEGEDKDPKDGDENEPKEDSKDDEKDQDEKYKPKDESKRAKDKEAQEAPEFQELDGPLKESIRKRLEAEKVLMAIWGDVQMALFEEVSALATARSETAGALVAATTARDDAKRESEADPDNEELEAALEAAEQAYETAKEADETAEKAVADKRLAFDLKAQIEQRTAGKAGFSIFTSGDEAVTADELKDLEALGRWDNSFVTRSLDHEGQFSTQPQWTKKGVFLFRATQLQKSPLKDYEDVKDEVRAAYITEEANSVGDKRKEKFEEELDRLGREKIKDKIAEIEAKKATDLEEQLAEWREDLQKRIEENQAKLENTGSSRARKSFEKLLTDLRAELADEEKKRGDIQTDLDDASEIEIEDEIAKVHKDILDEAAATAKFKVFDIEPRLGRPIRRGPIDHLSNEVQFLYYQGRVNDLEEGDSTGVLDDRVRRSNYFAVCTHRGPAELGDMTRLDVLEAIEREKRGRLAMAVRQSYSKEALVARLGFEEPGDDSIEAASDDDEEAKDDDKGDAENKDDGKGEGPK